MTNRKLAEEKAKTGWVKNVHPTHCDETAAKIGGPARAEFFRE
jgi:hypothetical protein